MMAIAMESSSQPRGTVRYPAVYDSLAYASLAEAVRAKDIARLNELLDTGLNPSSTIRGGPSPLELAMRLSTDRVALLLIERGADVSETPDGYSLFSLAYCHSEYRALSYALIKAGADVNYPGHSNASALFSAVARDDLDLCRALIAAGADVDAETSFGASPLRAAIDSRLSNSFELMRVLVKAGASTSTMPSSKNPHCLALTAFQYAVAQGFSKHVAFMIDEFREDPNQTIEAVVKVHGRRARYGLDERIVEAGASMLELASGLQTRTALYAAISARSVESATIAASGGLDGPLAAPTSPSKGLSPL
jgi:ankyrin repeat protein